MERSAHNTHYSTTDILRYLLNMIEEELCKHPYGKSSLGMDVDEVRGYRLGLVSVKGFVDSWLKYFNEGASNV